PRDGRRLPGLRHGRDDHAPGRRGADLRALPRDRADRRRDQPLRGQEPLLPVGPRRGLRGGAPGVQPALRARSSAAFTVFSSRWAMVMGPTPPGTGVITDATSTASP